MTNLRPFEGQEATTEMPEEWRQLSHLILQSFRALPENVFETNLIEIQKTIDALATLSDQIRYVVRLSGALQSQSDPRHAAVRYGRLILDHISVPDNQSMVLPDPQLSSYLSVFVKIIEQAVGKIQGRSMALFKAFYSLDEQGRPTPQSPDQREQSQGLMKRISDRLSGVFRRSSQSQAQANQPSVDDDINTFINKYTKEQEIKESRVQINQASQVEDARDDLEVFTLMMGEPFPPSRANFIDDPNHELRDLAQSACEKFDTRLGDIEKLLKAIVSGANSVVMEQQMRLKNK